MMNVMDKQMLSAIAMMAMNTGRDSIRVRKAFDEEGEVLKLDMEKIKSFGAVLCSEGLPLLSDEEEGSMLKFEGEQLLVEVIAGD